MINYNCHPASNQDTYANIKSNSHKIDDINGSNAYADNAPNIVAN